MQRYKHCCDRKIFNSIFLFGRNHNVSSSNQLGFASHNNHVISEEPLKTIIKRITAEYELPHITIHGFLRTYYSLLFEAGINMQNVKVRLLGHSDIKTTMDIDAHVTKTERSKTADLFSNFMESNLFLVIKSFTFSRLTPQN